MKQRLRVLLMVGVLVGWGLQGALAGADTTHTDSQAGELLKKAYSFVVEAELARADHHDDDAKKSFGAAISVFDQLKTQYPGWQAPIVNLREAECQNALAALNLPREPEASGRKDADEKAPGVTNTVARLKDLLGELRAAEATLAAVRTSGDESRFKQLASDVTRLKDELNDATKANQVLQRKITKLETKLRKAGDSSASGTNGQYQAVTVAVKSEVNRLVKANELGPAIALITEAMELLPADSDLTVLLAITYCRAGQFEETVKLLKPFDVWWPKNADALLTLGTAYMGLGQIGKARDITEKSLSIKPDSADAHYNLAQILLSISPPDVEGAYEHYQRALELGAPYDLAFESALKTATIMSRIKKHTGTPWHQSSSTDNTQVRTPG